MSLATTFARWGTPPRPVSLSDAALGFLDSTLGTPGPRPAVALADVTVPEGRLPRRHIAGLAAIVGEAAVSVTASDRLAHAAGCSIVDYLRLRAGDVVTPPDAVVRPGGHDQAREVLSYCSNHGLSVVPFGGGTSVVGGVTRATGDPGPAVAIAFDRMAEVHSVDETSMLVTVGPGITGPVLERILGVRGLTLGHLPQSWERASIGGYVATRSAGQASTGYGRSDDMVEGLRIATPMGELRLGRAHRNAAGPDLRQLFIGSEGAFGLITEVTLRIRRAPTTVKYEALMLPDYSSGVAAFRELAHRGLTADVMRLSDCEETSATLAMSGPQGRTKELLDRYLDLRSVNGGAMAVLGWEAHSRLLLASRRRAAWSLLRDHGAVSLGTGAGESWRRHRFDGPYLRDELLDRGYIVETLETATIWANLDRLRQSVRAALEGSLGRGGTPSFVMSHVSHVYETGASLYFTVLAPAAADPVAQWRAAKAAACDAIVAGGGTITHHHAIGRDHAPWLEQEIGTEGVRVLRAVKQCLDPEGIMNPGVLLEPK